MKISYNWLKQLINIDLSLEEVCEKLTMSGLEVEHIIETESIKGGLKDLIVGEAHLSAASVQPSHPLPTHQPGQPPQTGDLLHMPKRVLG